MNRALRQVVWPVLKEHGFTRRTARTAWRDGPDQVDVVNFQSFNAYHASVMRVTSYSFAVNLGIHPRCRTDQHTRVKDGQLRPEEWQCEFRRQLSKRVVQRETKTDLWYVRPDGSNLAEVTEDARDVLLSDGLAWFSQLDGLDALLETARNTPEADGGTWGMGGLGSPHRVELVAALAAAVEDRQRSA